MAQLLRLQPIQMLLAPALLGKPLLLCFFGLLWMDCHVPLVLHWFSRATLRAWLWAALDEVPCAACVVLA